MMRLDSADDLAAAVGRLNAAEPRFALIVARHGLPALRRTEAGLRSLLRIVTDQMISLSAGDAIWNRLVQELEPFEPDTVLARSEAELRKLGLSAAKARTFHAAARAFRSGMPSPAGKDQLTDEHIMGSLMGIPGVGPWTAQIYLLTVIGSADAWPAADLALQMAAMDLLALPARPAARELEVLAEGWRPHRSAAALLLWSHYRALKGMPQA